MKKGLLFAGLVALLSLIINSCEKENANASGEVELYLLESFETIDQTCAIDLSTVVINDKPLIGYSDFKFYNSKDHVFKITENAGEVLDIQEHSVHGLPFAIVADKKTIYTGYFWPSYSSASCQWIVIDPLMLHGNNELHVELGYPGLIEGFEIPDERNNQLILDIFKRDKKLLD